MLKGLERLQKKCEEGGSNLTNVLLGQSDLSPPQEVNDIQFFDATLNDSQKEAVRFALGSPEISLIHGPPGVRLKKYDKKKEIQKLTHCYDRQARHIHWLKLLDNYL